MTKRRGFTLAEIIVVMIIIGILATIAIPNYLNMVTEGSAKNAKYNLQLIFTANENYYLNHGSHCFLADQALLDCLNISVNDRTSYTYTCFGANSPGQYACYTWSNAGHAQPAYEIGHETLTPHCYTPICY